MSALASIRGLYAMVDASYVTLDIAGQCAALLCGAGARVVQLRAKGCGSAAVLNAARQMRGSLAGRAVLIVNDRVDIAMLSGADGVHLGQDDLPLDEARRLMPGAIIGVSTHNIEEALRAERGGADYISFGPIFPTSTKTDADSPKGTWALKELASRVSLPIVAIGGITAESAPQVARAGASAVAVISDILLAPEMRERAAAISAALEAVRDETDG